MAASWSWEMAVIGLLGMGEEWRLAQLGNTVDDDVVNSCASN